jgi:2-isopropylmalate synthase
MFYAQRQVRITEKTDEFGIHYVEGGWPGSNPKDLYYFKEVRKLDLRNTHIVAFSSTMKANTNPEDDEIIRALMQAQTEYVTIVGKSWDLHVKDALRVSWIKSQDDRQAIADLKKSGKKGVFDAGISLTDI